MAKLLEKDIQKSILSYLKLKKHFMWRNNSGAFKTESGGFYQIGTVGSPDIIGSIKGQFIGIEVKRDAKHKLSTHQEAFKCQLEASGGRYIVAYSVDDIISAGL